MKLKSNPSKTVLTIVVGFLVLYSIYKWEWALAISIIIGIAGVLSDFLAQKIEWLWFKLTWVLSLIVPNILLSIIFYLFLFPISVLARIISKSNFLQLKKSNSTWVKVEKTFDGKSMQNPW